MRAYKEAIRGLLYMNARTRRSGTSCGDDLKNENARRRSSPCSRRSRKPGRRMSASKWPPSAFRFTAGMGFIEETGAAQFYRDIRIAPIYEGTNGIQSIDLVTRKLGDAQRWRGPGDVRPNRGRRSCLRK